MQQLNLTTRNVFQHSRLGLRSAAICYMVFIVVSALICSAAIAQQAERTFGEKVGNFNKTPKVAEGIAVDSMLGDTIDPDLAFTDEENNFVRLGDLVDGTQPTILSFNYSNCPNLCEVQLKHLTMALRDVQFDAGKDFQLISVSIDPKEQLDSLRGMRDKYTKLYNRKGSKDHFHFLRGETAMVEHLADLCGVRYQYIKRQKRYAHPAVFILLSPDGKIVRYIHGLDYEPVTIYRALVEAAEGKIGSPINWVGFVTGCFLFDETTGKYSFAAMGLMRIAGFITIIGLAFSVLPYWWVTRGRGERGKTSPPNQSTDNNEHKQVPQDEL